MDPLDELLIWAKEKGVKLDGIKPERMPGRGVGIVATRQIAVSLHPARPPPYTTYLPTYLPAYIHQNSELTKLPYT